MYCMYDTYIQYIHGAAEMKVKPEIKEKIIAAAKMEDCNPNWTPTKSTPLGADTDGKDYEHSEWKYVQ